jgi:tRNA threonylcarbamoyladenosine biosynthesis protein TsaE
MRALGAQLAAKLAPGDVVLLTGELGAGKTTLVRGVLEAMGWLGAVRSPTFNLFSVYDTTPPVLHADLYRVNDASTLGIEDYLETHICLVEWPAALATTIEPASCIGVTIEFAGEGRTVELSNILV